MKLGIVAGLALAGCASQGRYTSEDAVVQRLLQMDKGEIAQRLGAPTRQVAIDATREAWTYESTLAGATGGQCKISVSFEGEEVTAATLSALDRSPFAAPLGSCRQVISALD